MADGAIIRIEDVSAAVDRDEVLRYLGYPAGTPPTPRVTADFDHWVRQANCRAAPRAVYRVLAVTRLEPHRLAVHADEGEVAFRGAIGEFLGAAEYVAPFIATAGPGVERLASELMSAGNALAAMIVNAVGAERAEAAEAAVIDQLRDAWNPRGFAPTLPYSPGYCGMALTEQPRLFSLLGDNVGVTLTPDCLMQPLKSVSGLIGLGPAARVQGYGSPCDRCELYACSMRR